MLNAIKNWIAPAVLQGDEARTRLRFRLTVILLAFALTIIWLISLYLVRIVREDMERLVGEQQLSTASIVAMHVNSELQDRLNVLTTVAAQVSKGLLARPADVQSFLKDHPSISLPFNGGIFITGVDGTAIADFPVVPGRVGTNYIDRESISVPLREGRSVIGRPNLGKTLKAPIFSIVVPIRDQQGAVIGAIAGTINLGLPNFLDKMAMGRYGKSGGYLLIAAQHRLIVTASDKSRVMENLPAVGVIPAVDRMIGGDKGTVIFVNAKGVEVMNSGVPVPVSNWRVVVSVPTEEVFAPVRDMRQRVMIVALIAALIATLLAVTLTARLLRSQHFAMLSLYDPLTQLANRRLLMDRLAQALESGKRNNTFGALMFMDLDQFKPLNDQYGHAIGDLLLVEVASRLKDCVRAVDTVSRIGGDEFVVLLAELTVDKVAAVEQANRLAEKIRANLARPYLLPRGDGVQTIEHHCSASIGVVLFFKDHQKLEDLLKWADVAMYQSKAEGRNRVTCMTERRAKQRS